MKPPNIHTGVSSALLPALLVKHLGMRTLTPVAREGLMPGRAALLVSVGRLSPPCLNFFFLFSSSSFSCILHEHGP